jgi:hypothetical protein
MMCVVSYMMIKSDFGVCLPFLCLRQYVHGILPDKGEIDGCEVQSSNTLSLQLVRHSACSRAFIH